MFWLLVVARLFAVIVPAALAMARPAVVAQSCTGICVGLTHRGRFP